MPKLLNLRKGSESRQRNLPLLRPLTRLKDKENWPNLLQISRLLRLEKLLPLLLLRRLDLRRSDSEEKRKDSERRREKRPRTSRALRLLLLKLKPRESMPITLWRLRSERLKRSESELKERL